jgi:hypothetical protein
MAIPYSYVKRFTAGAVFGMYMAYLLYFLNPQLDTDVPRVAVAAITYAVICGLLFGTALWLLRWTRVRLFGRSETIRQHGFGNMAAAVALSAAVYWIHLALFRIYLPRGAVRVLSKATILIAATAFLLFLLWFFERTASRRVSRLIFASGVVVVAVSAILLYQRRDGYRDTSREVVLTEASPVAAQNRIVVVALRSVPYDWLLTAFGEGIVPNLESLHDNGFATRIEPFRTSSPKALWASLATGQLPSRHGVTGRYSYHTALNRQAERFTLLPGGVGFRAWGLIPPVERIAPQLPAGESIPFWQCFDRMELNSNVVNWPGTVAQRTHRGHLIPDRALRDERFGRELLPLDSGLLQRSASAVVPPASLARLARLRDKQRQRVSAAFARDNRAAVMLLDLQRSAAAPLAVVSFNSIDDTIDAVGAKENGLPAKGTAAGDAIRGNLILFDHLIGDLRAANPEALFVIVSPSAPQPPAVPISFGSIVDTLEDLSDPGESNGFVILSGRGFAHRANPDPVELVDVVPTLLFTATLPLARDFDGEVISDAFEEAALRGRAVTYVASYRPSRFVVRR